MRKEISEKLMSSSSKVDKEKNYWLDKLSGELVKSHFPYDFNTPGINRRDRGQLEFLLPGEAVLKLNRLTNRSDRNLYTILMACLVLLLNKYSYNRHTDIIIGAPIYRQPVEGNFLNTVLAVRNRFALDNSFKELILLVKKNLAEANENMNYPVERLLYHLDIPVSEDAFSLFETVILMENIHERKYIQHINSGILFSFLKKGDGAIQGVVEYDAGLYREETIQRIMAHLLNLLQGIDKIINQRIAEIEILLEEERHRLLEDFNRTGRDYPADKTVCRLFEEQVEKTPGGIAVISEKREKRLTYKELNEKSNRLAGDLRERGVLADSIAGIMVEPSLEMITGILAILKAGAAYLPIDPEYPQERIDFMLKDSSARILLTLAGLSSWSLNSSEGRPFPPATCNLHLSPAYIIYTSGTTGKPKGVALTNRNLVNYVCWLSKELKLTAGDRTVLTSSFAFDLGYTAVYGSLLNGGQLHLVPRERYIFAESLLEYIKENKITFLKVTPSLFTIMVNGPGFSMDNCASLRVVLLGGEPIIPLDVEEAHRRCPHLGMMNHYGPTEATIGCIAQFIDFHQLEVYRETPTIGKPIHNTRVYILGRDMKPVPPGAGGELCLSGDGLAAGYLNHPELTEQKFCGGAGGGFSKEPPARRRHCGFIYKTGDLGRWTLEGVIEFLGRIDQQVKIRGFRIELREIETRLLGHEAVKETVVAAGTGGEGHKFLCAYIVPVKESAFKKYSSMAEELRNYLTRSLPDYMVPSYFVSLDALPLTPNGKVDRRALPEPKASAGADYQAPQNETEGALAEVWQDVFGIQRVGINDNFFEMGGDSIKAIQVSARLLKANLKVEVRDLFTKPTIKELGKYVRQVQRVIHQGAAAGEVPLTPVQHWFFQQDFTGGHHFNLALMICRKDRSMDEAVVEKVLAKITTHHDALRMVYERAGDRVVQVNRGVEGKFFHLEVIRLEREIGTAIKAEANRIQGSIHLEKGPLLKAGLFKTPAGDYLLMVIHHLVVDGVSWRILLEDFSLGYLQAERGEDIQFQDKTDSFKTWSERLPEYVDSKEALKELAYWKETERMKIEPLPTDHVIGREQRKVKHNETPRFHLTEAETEQLLKKVHRVYNTEVNDILMTAAAMAVAQWAGTDKIAVNLEGHGREPLVEGIDVSRTVGWFTTHFPVVLDIREEPLSSKIKRVKEALRRIPNRGSGYGILKYLAPEEKKQGVCFALRPQINFNYLGQFDSAGNPGGQDAVFSVSSLETGDPVNPEAEEVYTFNISGMTVDGKLTLAVTYNTYEYEKETVEKLTGLLHRSLLDIIAHCSEKEERELTPSDVGDEELTIEELSEIEEMIQI